MEKLGTFCRIYYNCTILLAIPWITDLWWWLCCWWTRMWPEEEMLQWCIPVWHGGLASLSQALLQLWLLASLEKTVKCVRWVIASYMWLQGWFSCWQWEVHCCWQYRDMLHCLSCWPGRWRWADQWQCQCRDLSREGVMGPMSHCQYNGHNGATIIVMITNVSAHMT